MTKLILAPVFLIMIVITYFSMKGAIKSRKNIVFGVTLPKEALTDEAVLDMISTYKRITNKYILLMGLAALPMFFTDKEVVAIMYSVVWSIVVSEWLAKKPYINMNRKLKKLKKEREWFVGEKRVVNVDTKISMLKDKMPIPNKIMIIPFIISMIPTIISIVKYNEELKYSILIAFVLLGSFIILYFVGFRGTNKIRLKVYSENSEINYILNKEERYLNSIIWFLTALTSSIIFLLTYLLLFEIIDMSFLPIISIAVLGSLIIPLGFIYTNNKIKKLEEELLEMDNEIVYTDDDEYWIDGYKYYNENDHNTKVNPRFGFNSYTYNLATKKGKLSYYSGIIMCAVIMIPVFISLIDMEFYSPKITILQESISVDYPYYDFEFSAGDIEEIKLVEEISFRIRTNGIGTDEYCRGNFNSSEYGKCKVYIYNESKPYIVVNLGDKCFIYNEKTRSETMKIYNQLQQITKK